jgi:hypothetical protein
MSRMRRCVFKQKETKTTKNQLGTELNKTAAAVATALWAVYR